MTAAEVTTLVEPIRRIMAEIIDLPDLEPDEDFFEAGGVSLQAALLIARIEQRIRPGLRLADVHAARTAQALAAALARAGGVNRQAESEVALSIVPLGGEGVADPVFMVHWIERDLARGLARRRPVFGLSFALAAGPNDPTLAEPVGVAALAQHYLEALRTRRPHGPYHLIGHSLGGVIAWEMARRLQLEGEPCGLLCLIDCRPPGPKIRLGPREAVRNLLSLTPGRWLRLARGRLTRWLGGFDLAVRDLALRRLRGLDHRMDAYRMTPLATPLLLVEARRPQPAVFSAQPAPMAEALAAIGLCGDAPPVISLPGDHLALVKAPLAGQIAEAFERRLEGLSSTPAR